MYRRKILCWLIGIASFLPLLAQPKYEIRASWVTTLGGMDWPRQKANSPEGIKRQKEELCQLLDQLKEANFNTVLFQTRLRDTSARGCHLSFRIRTFCRIHYRIYRKGTGL